MSKQGNPASTGTSPATPKKTPPVRQPVNTTKSNKPTGAKAPTGKQGRG